MIAAGCLGLDMLQSLTTQALLQTRALQYILQKVLETEQSLMLLLLFYMHAITGYKSIS